MEDEGEGRHRDSLVARGILRRRGLVVKEPISVIDLWRGHLDHLAGYKLIGDIRGRGLI